MVEIRVALTDATEAHGCCGVSRRSFDHSSVSFDGRCNEVRVRSEWESRSVVRMIRGRQGHTRGRQDVPAGRDPQGDQVSRGRQRTRQGRHHHVRPGQPLEWERHELAPPPALSASNRPARQVGRKRSRYGLSDGVH
jgi:hypothetical protein